jgi:hypothetical protein
MEMTTHRRSGLPDFSLFNEQKRGKIYQNVDKNTKRPKEYPNGNTNNKAMKYTKLFHPKSFQDIPKLA